VHTGHPVAPKVLDHPNGVRHRADVTTPTPVPDHEPRPGGEPLTELHPEPVRRTDEQNRRIPRVTEDLHIELGRTGLNQELNEHVTDRRIGPGRPNRRPVDSPAP
jgi:hypothetical protein